MYGGNNKNTASYAATVRCRISTPPVRKYGMAGENATRGTS